MNVLSYPSPQNVNQWDEEWEVGGIDISTGQTEAVSTRIRSKNYIPCSPNTSYYVCINNSGADVAVRLFWYDANYNFISTVAGVARVSKTSPQNAYYLKIMGNDPYGTTYLNDISINYPSTDTDYHAYQRSLVLTPSNKVVTLDGGGGST